VLKFTDPSTCPPGGYVGEVPETGFKVQTWTWRSLLEKLHAHRVANGIPIKPGWEIAAEDFACRGMPPGVCHETDPRFGWLSGAAMRFEAVLEGTRILGSWMASGRPMVSQEQADARSAVCAGCTHNVDPAGCQTCAWPALTNLVAGILGKHTSRHHENLKSCASCGCNLKVKVWVPLEHLKASFKYGELPAWCWIKREMEENNG
jgi:hypothetical protein